MDRKDEHTHHEDVYSKPKKGGRVKNCCRRFWWAIILVIIVGALVTLLPIIYVGIPNKAQQDINKSSLEVTKQEVTSPTSDSVHLHIESLIKSDSPFHPEIEGFPASLSLKGQKPFFIVNVPGAKSDKETHVVIDQEAKIQDMAAFKEYTKTTLLSETFEVHMDGKTTLHLKGLPAMKVNYNKVITMKGLNKLSSLHVSDLKMLDKPLPDGTNLVGTANIDNPSIMTLDLGNVTMVLSIDSTQIGTSQLMNVVLKPGPNAIPMRSQAAIMAIAPFLSKAKDGKLTVDVVGNSSVSNGQHLTYYEEALKSNPTKLDLDIGSLLGGLGH